MGKISIAVQLISKKRHAQQSAFAADSARPFEILSFRIDPGVAITLIVYVAWYGFLILRGNSIPYIMDNNESFSALNHAYNLWHFDFFRSFGLTDEAVSPDPAAHPYVHTHQGNFPRLFAFVLYGLGARSIESQILLTTMTVGIASVVMAYYFFRRLAGAPFATIAVLLLITDYLMFAQWQVNTYRVWQGFLLFAAFLCVHGFSEWPRRWWAIATVLTYAALFYGELVFAAFVAFTVAFYTIWTYRRAPGSIVLAGIVQGGGAALGLATLILQLILYLGWQDFTTDLRLTLTARNYAPDDSQFVATLRDFYENRNIVFLYNLQSSDQFVGLFASLQLLFRFVLQTSTPFLSLVAISMATAALLADSRRAGPDDIATVAPTVLRAAVAQLIPGVFLFILAMIGGDSVMGLRASGMQGTIGTLSLVAFGCLLLAAALAYVLAICARAISINGTFPGIYRALWTNFFFMGLGLLIMAQGELYDQSATALWWQRLTPVPAWLGKIVVCIVAYIGAMLILTGRRAVLGRWHAAPSSLAPFLLCGALGYLVIYKLSAGYLYSGYLVRLCPFVVFHVDALFALGLFVPLAMSVTLLGRTDFNNLVTRSTCGAAGAIAVALVVLWTTVQARYFVLFPPDRMSFTKLLRDPSIGGRGLISNNYAAPFGFVAGTWAYMQPDPRAVTDQSHSSRTGDYVWLADRRSNPDYSRPKIYVCFNSWSTASVLVADVLNRQTGRLGCSSNPIVERARSGKNGPPPNSVILARDTENDHWAILQLEWPSSR
jgi:hypothetical protein